MADCERFEPLLSALLDGELDARAAAEVACHLDRCLACATEAEHLRRVRALVRSMPVRRLPGDVRLEAGGAAPSAAPARRRVGRAGATAAVLGGLLTGAAFSLGGQPPPDTRVVSVPMDVYVADHFVHTVNRATFIPVGLESQR